MLRPVDRVERRLVRELWRRVLGDQLLTPVLIAREEPNERLLRRAPRPLRVETVLRERELRLAPAVRFDPTAAGRVVLRGERRVRRAAVPATVRPERALDFLVVRRRLVVRDFAVVRADDRARRLVDLEVLGISEQLRKPWDPATGKSVPVGKRFQAGVPRLTARFVRNCR